MTRLLKARTLDYSHRDLVLFDVSYRRLFMTLSVSVYPLFSNLTEKSVNFPAYTRRTTIDRISFPCFFAYMCVRRVKVKVT